MDPINFQARDASAIAEDVRYAIQVATSYRNQIEGAGLKLDGLKMLELGPGINFGPPLILASFGARVAVADRFLAPWQQSYHPAFYEALLAAWSGPGDALRRTIEDGSYETTLRLIHQPAEALSDVADDEFELVMSNAVLEHVYDFAAVTRELARITCLGGVNLHQIDYRDHLSFDRPLEFLLEDQDTFSEQFTESSGQRGNRVRPSEAEAMFESAGFTVRDNSFDMTAPNDYFEDFLPRLRRTSSCFRNWSDGDLRKISGLLRVVRVDDPAVRAAGEDELGKQAATKLSAQEAQ